ncbi:MAG: hypothetical protein KJO66_03190 [Gammaproteobacteria bacterium]|nr:hypothetical protein [Gammaproteobacteria bacterium]
MKLGGIDLTIPQVALLLANLLPVFGVLFMDWDVGGIIVLYWAENLVIGLYTILKMLVTGGPGAIGLVLFFCIHYGGFSAVHGIFVLKLTEFAGISAMQATVESWPGPLVLVEKLYDLVSSILAAAPDEMLWVLLAMVLSHGVSFLVLFIGQGEFREITASKLMQAPYRRVAVLHITVIVGAFLIVKLESPMGLLLALVALKTGMDIILHKRSHAERQLSNPESQRQSRGE